MGFIYEKKYREGNCKTNLEKTIFDCILIIFWLSQSYSKYIY